MAKMDPVTGLTDYSMGGAEHGISAERQAELTAAVNGLDASVAAMTEAIKEAETARQELLSWGRLIEKVADIVIPYIQQQMAAKPADAPAVPGLRQTLFTGLGGLLQLPAGERSLAASTLIQQLLAGFANK